MREEHGRLLRVGKFVVEDVVEPPEQGPSRMSGWLVAATTRLCERSCSIISRKLLSTRRISPDIVGEVPAGADGVEFVEEVDAASAVRGVKHLSQLGRGLAHEAGDEPVEADLQEGEAEFACEHRRSHRLARSGGTDEEELAARREAVVEDPGGKALFADHALKLMRERRVDDHVRQPVRGIGDLQEVGELTARLADGDEGRRAAPTLCLVDCVP